MLQSASGKKQIMLTNEITSYGAAMNVLMAYYHMEDDWQDERKVSSLTVKTMLRGKVKNHGTISEAEQGNRIGSE